MIFFFLQNVPKMFLVQNQVWKKNSFEQIKPKFISRLESQIEAKLISATNLDRSSTHDFLSYFWLCFAPVRSTYSSLVRKKCLSLFFILSMHEIKFVFLFFCVQTNFSNIYSTNVRIIIHHMLRNIHYLFISLLDYSNIGRHISNAQHQSVSNKLHEFVYKNGN